jgi:Rod binding domain-containing protein
MSAANRMPLQADQTQELTGKRLQSAEGDPGQLRKAFDSFVGETFYGQMLKQMRKTVGKTPYFDGGRAEEIFRGQLDQKLTEQMSKASASTFTGPMFELFSLSQK